MTKIKNFAFTFHQNFNRFCEDFVLVKDYSVTKMYVYTFVGHDKHS